MVSDWSCGSLLNRERENGNDLYLNFTSAIRQRAEEMNRTWAPSLWEASSAIWAPPWRTSLTINDPKQKVNMQLSLLIIYFQECLQEFLCLGLQTGDQIEYRQVQGVNRT